MYDVTFLRSGSVKISLSFSSHKTDREIKLRVSLNLFFFIPLTIIFPESFGVSFHFLLLPILLLYYWMLLWF